MPFNNTKGSFITNFATVPFKLIGPDANASQQLLLNKQGGTQSPDVKNIVILDKK